MKKSLIFRPAFVKSVKEVKISPITGKPELYVPKKRICITYTLTTSTIIFLVMITRLIFLYAFHKLSLFQMVLVICVFFAIIVYQTIFLYASTSKNGIKKESREMTVSIIASVISVIFIIIFQMVKNAPIKNERWLNAKYCFADLSKYQFMAYRYGKSTNSSWIR